MNPFKLMFLVLVLPMAACSQTAPDTGFVRANYVKSEVYVTMRDGVKLFTSIYSPKDNSTTYPIIMQRTPYSCNPYGVNQYRQRIGPNSTLMHDKYIFVYQDARGRYKSEGKFVEMTQYIEHKTSAKDVDESSDTYDTIDWLIKNTNNNGKVGITGISFPGFYSTASLPDAHPALKAVSPQAPMSDEFMGDDCNHNGAFFLLDNFGFYGGFDGKRINDSTNYEPFFDFYTTNAYQYFLNLGPLKNANTSSFYNDTNSTWRQVTAHDTYDEFWKKKNIRTTLKNIKPAVLIVGGWFDAEDLFGALQTYKSIEKLSPGNKSKLVMGPWTHGGWAGPTWTTFSSYDFKADLNKYYHDEIETKFFDFYLKDKGSYNAQEATIFETGSNQWKNYSQWPPTNSSPTAYYFDDKNKLSASMPVASSSLTEYISDPAHPVPYTPEVSGRRNNEYMAEDQRFALQRPDVIYFQTDTLAENLTLTGELMANLFVSTTCSDADFVVKLIDVWPDRPGIAPVKTDRKTYNMAGYQQMVRAEVMRGKFRNSFSKPEPFIKDKIEKVSFHLNDVAHTFLKGHRIMVQVQSSWFPLVDRNPQTFGNIFKASEKDFKKATIKIYHDKLHPSNLLLPVLK